MPTNTPPDVWKLKQPFILASQSAYRRRLLERAGFAPEKAVAADIDETVKPKESPRAYSRRIALEKAQKVAADYPNHAVLSADTVAVAGRRIIGKAQTREQARGNLLLLSGRRHRVLTSFCLLMPDGRTITRLVTTTVSIKKLDVSEIEALLDSGEWENVSAYQIEGLLSACVKRINGSYAAVVGLPVYEVAQVLKGALRA